MKILAIDSNYDAVTKDSCVYRNKHVYPYLKSKGFEIVRCQDQSARRSHVKSKIFQENIVYITGVVHGTDTTYMGQHCKPIFDIDKYQPEELENKIVHFFACQTASKLGPDFVNNGCLAYFGYNEDFIVLRHISDVFFDCDSEIDRAFADGLTAEQVYDRVIGYYNRKICELEKGGYHIEASYLEHNRDHLCATSVDAKWGDRKAGLLQNSK